MKDKNKQAAGKNFENGRKVTTPSGPGVVSEVKGGKVVVKLGSGETKFFTFDQVADDSDAG